MSQKRIIARVNLDNIVDNINNLWEYMPNPKPIMAVVKANGYGHGAIDVAKRLEKMSKIFGFAVSTADEAFELRNAGIKKPVLILGYAFAEDYERLILEDIILTVFDRASAHEISEAAKRIGKIAKVHLKIDTGMSRIGIGVNDEGFNCALEIAGEEYLDINGIFTHFAKADEIEREATEIQLKKFNCFIDFLHQNDIYPEHIHCANSAAILQYPSSHISIVRAGIVIYGLWPSNDMMQMNLDITLKPAMSLISHVVYIKEIEAGTSVSYGGIYTAESKKRIATIPVGYADGYPRSLSNKGYVLINGQKANIVGRICMDQMMVDVTDVKADVLDKVVLLGKSGDLTITAEEIGNISGRFNYEFVCDITPRVTRIY